MTETTVTPEVEFVVVEKPKWRRFVPSKTNVALATAVIVLFAINTNQARTINEITTDEESNVEA